MATLASPLRPRLLRCKRSRLGQLLEVGLELGDATHDPAAIDLELGLAAAEPGADPASLLREVGAAAATQARQAIAQQRQLDLSLALQRVGVLGEDVEDHGGSVDRRPAQQLLEIELLRRCQLVVEHDRVGVDGETDLLELLGLALADVPRVIGRVAALHHASDDVGSGGVDQQLELVETGVDGALVDPRQRDRDEHDLLPDRSVDQRLPEGFLVGGEVRTVHRVSKATQTSISIVPMQRGRTGERDAPWFRIVESHCCTAAIHLHDEFPVARSGQTPPGGGVGGGAGTGATGLGDAGPTLVDAHPDLVLSLPRLDDLEVDVRDLATEGQQVDDRHVVDADHAVRIAETEVDHRSIGVTTEPVPATRGVDRLDGPHVDTGVDRVGLGSGLERDAPVTGVGEDHLRAEITAALGQRLGEAADAVAAHLCSAAVGVEQRHPGGVAVGRFADQQPVGPDPTPAIAHSPRQRRAGRRPRDRTRRGSRCRARGAW